MSEKARPGNWMRQALSGWWSERAEAPAAALTCILCCDRPRTRLFHPCMHICACDVCAQRVSRCPLCQRDVAARWRVYLS